MVIVRHLFLILKIRDSGSQNFSKLCESEETLIFTSLEMVNLIRKGQNTLRWKLADAFLYFPVSFVLINLISELSFSFFDDCNFGPRKKEPNIC